MSKNEKTTVSVSVEKFPGSKVQSFGSIASFAIAVVGFLALALSYQANQTTIKSLEIANRPILALTNPSYVVDRKKMHFSASFRLVNFGRTPAHEFQKVNDKVLFVTTRRVFSKLWPNKKKQFEEIFFFRKGVLELFLEFFKKNPKATLEEVKEHFEKLHSNPDVVSNRFIKTEKNEIGFWVNGYSDVLDWTGPPTMLPPESTNLFRIGRSSGNEVDTRIDDGLNMIVVFIALEYEGIKPGKKFGYYFLGYYDNYDYMFKNKKTLGYPRELISFKEWSSREEI